MRLTLTIGMIILLAGCATSATVPASGKIVQSNEVFSGTATGNIDGSGTLHIVSTKGVACDGKFTYVTARQGEGIVSCTDGRSGPFTFASSGLSGNGHGTLGGQTFVFSFGDS